MTVYLGGTRVTTLSPAEANRRTSWSVCPADAIEYDGRACLVSPLEAIATASRGGRSTSIGTERPDVVGCSRVVDPPGTPGRVMGWIRPDQERACFSDFVVAVYVDDAERISGVNVVLSGP